MTLVGQTGKQRHSVLNCHFICLLPFLWTPHFEVEWTNFDANWQEWFMGQGHETVDFGGQ